MRERAAGRSSVTTIRGISFAIRIRSSLFRQPLPALPQTARRRMTPLRVRSRHRGGACCSLVIFELIRSRRLQERCAALAAHGRGRSCRSGAARDLVSTWSGSAYPPSALFVIAAFFILRAAPLLDGHLAAGRKNLALAQRLALLEDRLRRGGLEPEDGLAAAWRVTVQAAPRPFWSWERAAPLPPVPVAACWRVSSSSRPASVSDRPTHPAVHFFQDELLYAESARSLDDGHFAFAA